MKSEHGFSLIELVTVMVLIGILAGAVIGSSVPSSSLQLQSSRDTIVAVFNSAQQLAMNRANAVRLITASNSVDIRIDSNDDGDFSAAESIAYAGIQYPLSLPSTHTLTAVDFDFDRLGHTSSTTLVLSQGANVVSLEVSGAGYIR
ncbi:pilus assembly FimT family protein [Teredinibacter waterburyi]|jgi:prepilin-type N-terminal cleavage/methylation domain|uniref:pilus assembly FimT family protein n=1 Tax=Teredinibacter waterburyi TaxID=1500538 RepID=UPI00165FC645|nr:type II secretion system protein [Teredinibacter waterburyi]